MIPSINTFERLLRREVSQYGKTFIKNSIANDFYSSSLDGLSIWKDEEGITLFTILYSLKVCQDGAYTITYIGSSAHEISEEGYISEENNPHIYSLLSLI